MNIFAVHTDPIIAAQSLCDRHVVKMVLETAQLLSTAHRIIDGTKTDAKTKTGRNCSRWILADERNDILYHATHTNHPSAVWCRETFSNYNWLYKHFHGLLNEYTHRYDRVHKCAALTFSLRFTPTRISLGEMTPVALAMPDQYKVETDWVQSYRNYYKDGKAHLHTWTKRERPVWL